MTDIFYIDLFCGAGGWTTGIKKATYKGRTFAKVKACVNHDPVMIGGHKANNPEVLHFTEDVRDPRVIRALAALARQLRRDHPSCLIFLVVGLECTNFSKAKGGMPRSADSRTLADCLDLYIEALRPDGFKIENVEEFMSWGPLDDKGKPISRKAGSDYVKWVNRMCAYGYRFDYKILNSADFGAYTSRKRYFAQFMRPGLPLAWPHPTHSRRPHKDAFGELLPWKAVREVLDLEDHGRSIFEGKRRCEKSLERLWNGLVRYVAGGKEAYAKACKEGKAVRAVDMDPLLLAYYSSGKNYHSSHGPGPTVRTRDGLAVAFPQWLDKSFGGPGNHASMDGPAGTVLSNDHHYLVTPIQFLVKNFSKGGQHASIHGPNGSLLTVPKENLVTATQFTMDHQFGNNARSLDVPGQTILARTDKKPLYLITVEHGHVTMPVFETDSLWTIRIKEFMVMYDIVDIKMRMVKIPELKRIQGFPADYILLGTQADQRKAIGNSVVPLVARAWEEATCAAIVAQQTQTKVA